MPELTELELTEKVSEAVAEKVEPVSSDETVEEGSESTTDSEEETVEEEEKEQGEGEEDFGETSEDVDPETSETAPAKKGLQKRFNELTQKIKALEDDNRKLKEESTSKTPPVENAPVVKKPRLADFIDEDDPEAVYQEALAEYIVDKKMKILQASEQDKYQKAYIEERARAIESEFKKKIIEEEKTNRDFKKVAFNPEVAYSNEMKSVVMSDPSGPKLMYYLGKNPTEASRIAGLVGMEAAIEMGKLLSKLSNLSKKVQTKAKTPVNPIKNSSTEDVDIAKLKGNDLVDAVRKQLKI